MSTFVLVHRPTSGRSVADRDGICCRVSSYPTGWVFKPILFFASKYPRRKRRCVYIRIFLAKRGPLYKREAQHLLCAALLTQLRALIALLPCNRFSAAERVVAYS
jgi:hypothetical protein